MLNYILSVHGRLHESSIDYTNPVKTLL